MYAVNLCFLHPLVVRMRCAVFMSVITCYLYPQYKIAHIYLLHLLHIYLSTFPVLSCELPLIRDVQYLQRK